MRRSVTPAAVLALALLTTASAADPPGLKGVGSVLFLGDSNTYAGQYVEYVEAFLRARHPELRVEFLNVALPSETVSGLTEPGHAGGQFPRPDLHERLRRVLRMAPHDLVVACYGMNDGIYHPLSRERFERFQSGMIGLRNRVLAAGGKLLVLTPPVFDSGPIRDRTLPAGRPVYRQPFVGYDAVLERYAEWLLEQRSAGWDVIDIHGPMKRDLAERQTHQPTYHMAGDGVHFDAAGHWLIARQILRHWGESATALEAPTAADALAALPHGPEVLRLVEARQRLLKDAWLTAIGHERPGMARGLPLDEAKRQAGLLEKRLAALVGP